MRFLNDLGHIPPDESPLIGGTYGGWASQDTDLGHIHYIAVSVMLT